MKKGKIRIMANVKTRILSEIRENLNEKGLDFVDPFFRVPVSDISDLIEKQGQTNFAVYDEKTRQTVCLLDFNNSEYDRTLDPKKIRWTIFFREENKCRQTMAIRSIIQKTAPSIKIGVVTNTKAR